MRVMRREGRGRMDRAAGAVAGVGQLYFKYRVPTVLYYEGGENFLVNRARASPGLRATLATSRAFHMR